MRKDIKNYLLIVYDFILLIISFSKLEYGLFVIDINTSLGNIPYMIENIFDINGAYELFKREGSQHE